LKPSSPLYFQEFLARRWAEAIGKADVYFTTFDIGATREASQIWNAFCRHRATGIEKKQPEQQYRKFNESPAVDPATGWQISPVVAASLCMKPTRRLTPAENAKIIVLKGASPSFVIQRQLAMRFRSILRAEISRPSGTPL
jgi:hypothetical protein